MANLAHIENLLNSDMKARQEFFADPVSFLAREGITISPRDEARLRESVANLQKAPPAVPGGLPREVKPGNLRLMIRDELV